MSYGVYLLFCTLGVAQITCQDQEYGPLTEEDQYVAFLYLRKTISSGSILAYDSHLANLSCVYTKNRRASTLSASTSEFQSYVIQEYKEKGDLCRNTGFFGRAAERWKTQNIPELLDGHIDAFGCGYRKKTNRKNQHVYEVGCLFANYWGQMQIGSDPYSGQLVIIRQ